jgi:hypothetical protein
MSITMDSATATASTTTTAGFTPASKHHNRATAHATAVGGDSDSDDMEDADENEDTSPQKTEDDTLRALHAPEHPSPVQAPHSRVVTTPDGGHHSIEQVSVYGHTAGECNVYGHTAESIAVVIFAGVAPRQEISAPPQKRYYLAPPPPTHTPLVPGANC